MQTLRFNTTTKAIGVTNSDGELIFSYGNIPTVKVLEGYYEVMQKDETEKSFPILRLPIANTNMVIER
jgi:hypothetical protein